MDSGPAVSICLRNWPKVCCKQNFRHKWFDDSLLDHVFHLSFQPKDVFPVSHTIQLLQRLQQEAESLDEEETFVGKVYYFDDLPACLAHSFWIAFLLPIYFLQVFLFVCYRVLLIWAFLENGQSRTSTSFLVFLLAWSRFCYGPAAELPPNLLSRFIRKAPVSRRSSTNIRHDAANQIFSISSSAWPMVFVI